MNWYEPSFMSSIESFLLISLQSKGLRKGLNVELQYHEKLRRLLVKERPDWNHSEDLQDTLGTLGLAWLWDPEVNDENLDLLATLVSHQLLGFSELVEAVEKFLTGTPEQWSTTTTLSPQRQLYFPILSVLPPHLWGLL